jgi:uroporphyrinogen-III decarboxylase
MSDHAMNSRERVGIAMQLGTPDRVPVFCQLAIGHYFLQASSSPVDIWFRSEGFADALVELQRRYRFDGILVNLPGRDPDVERHIDRIEHGPHQTTVHWKNGCVTGVPRDDNPHYYQADGSRLFPSFAEVDPERLWYVEPWDLTDVTYPYTWGFDEGTRPYDDFFPPHHLDTIAAVRSKTRGTVSVHSEVFSPFSQFLELLNYQIALMALVEDRGKVHACLDRLTEGAIDLASRQAAAGVDAVLISSAFAGAGYIGAQHYAEFVLPYERRVISALKDRYPDVSIYTHTCGAIGDRLDLMLETGTEGIDALDPPPLGTVDLEIAVRVLEGRAFIKGNLDPVNTMLRGNERTVRDAVLHRLQVAKPGGGYILSTACSVAPGVEPKLLELLSTLAIERGRYD